MRQEIVFLEAAGFEEEERLDVVDCSGFRRGARSNHYAYCHVVTMIVAFFLCLGAGAQDQPPAGVSTLSVTSRLVVLDVVVLDKNDHPVTNLDRSQFTITEDVVSQNRRSFDPPSGHAMPAGSATHGIVQSSG